MVLLLVASCAVHPLVAAAAEPVHGTIDVKSKIESIGLFKNGLAVVRRTVSLPGAGTFVAGDVPDPVHGTFWIESESPIEARITQREVTEPTDGRWEHDPQGELAGRQVTVYLRQQGMAEVTGRVVKFDSKDGRREWSRSFEQPGHWNPWWNNNSVPPGTTVPAAPRYLAIDTSSGRVFLDTSMIAYLKTEDPPTTRTISKPVLQFHVRETAGPMTVHISYLTKGISWAPSYRVDIADPKSLRLAQSAVIRNELEDFEDAEIRLISGFPSMEFSHVLSPMSPRTTWASFFSQLNRVIGSPSGRGGVMMQQVMSNVASYGPSGGDDAIMPASEGVDVHYHSIGQRSLREGDAIVLTVAEADAAYERIVEWMIPDTRDEWGRPVEEYQRQQFPDKYDSAAWDALRFDNPYDFPMTTAPTAVVAGDRFQGQRMTNWVNPGDEATVRITKALSVRTNSVEYEEEGGREIIAWGGRNFRKVPVKGELQICNHRKEAVRMVIRREFSGDLVAADASPETKLLERGVYSVNRRQELVWTIDLDPGEERKLTYQYTALVWH
jgi:hypothetical protein